MTVAISWQPELSLASRRYSIVFVHLGRALIQSDQIWDIEDTTVITVTDFLEDRGAEGWSQRIVIRDVETTVGSRRFGLGPLRERVMSEVELGRRFILQSRIARGAYPETLGSDLLADAKHVFPSLVSGVDATGCECLPGWLADGPSKVDFLGECMQELGADTISLLVELLWEAQLGPNDALRSISGVDLESLRSTGLVVPKNGEAAWVVSSDWRHFRAAVAAVSSRYAVADDWLAQAFVDLWLIERRIRNALRDALVHVQGQGWRATCLPAALQEEVLGRARRDTQPSATKMADLRDPLEWLTTSELFDLRVERELGQLGLESALWARLREVVMPIRNRAAHMRIIGERDARTVATWRRVVEDKVTGRPDLSSSP